MNVCIIRNLALAKSRDPEKHQLRYLIRFNASTMQSIFFHAEIESRNMVNSERIDGDHDSRYRRGFFLLVSSVPHCVKKVVMPACSRALSSSLRVGADTCLAGFEIVQHDSRSSPPTAGRADATFAIHSQTLTDMSLPLSKREDVFLPIYSREELP